MECNKLGLGKGFLKVRAKVTGFLIAKIEKRNTPEQVIVTKKRNTILTTGLQNLLNAFQTYMSGVNYVGENGPSQGIIVTTSSGQQITLPFFSTPAVSVTSNSSILAFIVRDDSVNSYTATSEELITTSTGYNIPIATASLSVSKNSDEILTMTWVITISISPSSGITYIPTLTPQNAGISGCTETSAGDACNLCTQSTANSQYGYNFEVCTPTGLTSQYSQTNFITSTLFTDMFYNTYSKGSSNSFTQVSNTTLIIYAIYCLPYFVAGITNNEPVFVTISANGSSMCIAYSSYSAIPIDIAYLQVYFPSETEPYVGVQIEFTT
jgi:hypothetical protein